MEHVVTWVALRGSCRSPKTVAATLASVALRDMARKAGATPVIRIQDVAKVAAAALVFLSSLALGNECAIVTCASVRQAFLVIQEIARVASTAMVILSSEPLRKNEVAIGTFACECMALIFFQKITIIAATAVVILSSGVLQSEYAIRTCASQRPALLALKLIAPIAAAALVLCSSLALRKDEFAKFTRPSELLASLFLQLVARVAFAAMVVLGYLAQRNQLSVGTCPPITPPGIVILTRTVKIISVHTSGHCEEYQDTQKDYCIPSSKPHRTSTTLVCIIALWGHP